MVLSRKEYCEAVEVLERIAADSESRGDVNDAKVLRATLLAVAEYRVVLHNDLLPLLDEAIEDCDDPQQLAQFVDTRTSLQRGYT